MVSTLRTRIVVVVCLALSLTSVAVVLGLATLVEMNARRQVDLAVRVLGYATTDRSAANPLDPAEFADALPRNTTVIFADRGGSHVLWATSSTDGAQELIDEFSHNATPADDIVDARLGGYPVMARLLRFQAPVTIRNPDTGWRTDAEAAVVALGARSATKLMRVMTGVAVVVTLATMAGAAAAATVVVRRTMRPLSGLAERVDALGPRPPPGLLRRGAADVQFRESATLTNAIADLVDRCARAESELREFIANTSHELRTPLTKIQGWSELYFQRPPTARGTERAMRSIVEECDRMRTMVDQLALLARAEAPPQVPSERVDLGALCRMVAEDIAVIAPERRVIVEITDQPVEVVAHADRIAQVLRNILGNSLVHAGADATIGVKVIAGRTDALVELSDDGCGIPVEHHDRLFDRYYSASPVNGSGSGLGLAIVRAIMSTYGGEVTLRSAPSAGTTVTLRFPRDRCVTRGLRD